MKKTITALLMTLTIAFGFGCAQKGSSTKPSQSSQSEFFAHQVMYQGETLSIISRWYTGSAQRWPEILSRNPQLDPRKLRSGTIVQIPRSMMVRDTPMPRSAVAVNSSTPTTNTQPEVVATPEPTSENDQSSDNFDTNPLSEATPDSVVDDDSTELEVVVTPVAEPTKAPKILESIFKAVTSGPKKTPAPAVTAEPVVTEEPAATLAPTAVPTEEPTSEPTALPTSEPVKEVVATPVPVEPTKVSETAKEVPTPDQKRTKTRDDLLKELSDEEY